MFMEDGVRSSKTIKNGCVVKFRKKNFVNINEKKNHMYQNLFYEEHKHDVYSQNGEDGVIEKMLNILSIKDGWVCEFGAWDGKHLSNTFALVEKGFKAVFIEGDPIKFKDLQTTSHTYPNIVPILAYVDHDQNKQHSLDKILIRTNIPKDFSILSIDIDSYDFQVWESLQNYRPRIVIIEINSSINPKRLDYIHQRSPEMSGSGFAATLQLAKEKQYHFIAHTGNMIFIRDEDVHLFSIPSDPYTCFRENWML